MSQLQLILASASPRRKEILETLGLSFRVVVAETDEHCDLTDPGARVEEISKQKCLAAHKALVEEQALTEETLIIASDTLVTLDGVFLGKPRDEEDACRMVGMLSGKGHIVASGLALWYQGRVVTSHELTRVYFSDMSHEEICRYAATGEPMGKAGAYAIQGRAARYIERIEGDYFNVVGLPAHRLCATVKAAFGLDL